MTRDGKGMEELRTEIRTVILQVIQEYQLISEKLSDCCEKFQKAVLQV